MTISRNRKLCVFLLFILGSFIAAHLCFRLLPNVFETGNAQAVDQLYMLRASIQTFRPAYDPTVAYVDLNNTYFGMAFELMQTDLPLADSARDWQVLDYAIRTSWHLIKIRHPLNCMPKWLPGPVLITGCPRGSSTKFYLGAGIS